jgi:hypothetical protein
LERRLRAQHSPWYLGRTRSHDLARHETPELNDRLGHLAQVLKNAFRLDPVFRIVIVLRVGVAWDDKGIEEPEKWLKLVFYS